MKTLLTITRASEKRNVSDKAEDMFTVMINPEQVRHDQQLLYDDTKKQGQTDQELKFGGVGADRVAFDIVLDGTGVVRQKVEDTDITKQLRKLRKIVYRLGNDTPQPDPVRLLWGTFLFFGRLSTLNTSFTLFKPSGEPLRAKVSLAFLGSVRHEEDELKTNAKRDNAMRLVDVREGDTLALLCMRVYGDASCYAEVAKHNGLDRIDPLEPGKRLEFPPRRKS